MWDRRELKARGKAAFRANYWRCVLVALILALLVGGGTAGGAKKANDTDEDTTLIQEIQSMPREVAGIIAGAVVGVSVVGFAVKLLLLNPLIVGCKRFFLSNSEAPAEFGELGFGFKNGYGNMVISMFLRDLFIALWCILLVIPGIIMAYAYRMVPYLLAENPGMSAMEAIRTSKAMMKGHKWNAFVLDLSFIGWYLLTALTAGIVGVLWTNPYVEATGAELYKAIR